MSFPLTQLFQNQDSQALGTALQQEPKLANTGITYLDQGHGPLAHPLHRLCDAVFAGLLTDIQAVEIAKILIENGANINGNYAEEGSTPLIAAASLHCQELGIYYIDKGADVTLLERNGQATALHWACFCGLDKLTQRLINAGANIDQREPKFNCTPAEWAVHALISEPQHIKRNQLACVKILLKAGANQSLFAERFSNYLLAAAASDAELRELLQ